MRILQVDTDNIKHNVRCRMDPGTCSENMLSLNSKEQTSFGLGNACNRRFFNKFRASLEEFYANFTRIHGRITYLQSDLVLFDNDPILPLINTVRNDIRNAYFASKPQTTWSLPLSGTYTNDGSGETGLLMDLIQTINNFGNFLNAVFTILDA
ncbi:uncharacterized protein LOC132755974 [Ruditapes philippinarum]|uniref:uncharacterized protein LOC132755974 n=1 Tax=Ruditapes philippinarum TaxID=129788 RepID=UPI00295A8965|nr:uncharacterized protein LOC132755974 [Ruditapes philippinarum]